MIPKITYIDEIEFNNAPGIYKLISHEYNHKFASVEINNSKYYLGWQSSSIEVEILYIKEHNFLLFGVDLQVTVFSLTTNRIVFSLGTSTYFLCFTDRDRISFVINIQIQDIVINKNSLSISQIIGHDLIF